VPGAVSGAGMVWRILSRGLRLLLFMRSEESPRDWLAVQSAGWIACVSLGFVGLSYTVADLPIEVHSEGGVIEMLQVMIWSAALVFGLTSSPRSRDGRSRMLARWLAMVAGLALLRELDLHEAANPEVLGAWGIRYRLDWWVSLDAPVLPRVMWAGVFIGLGWVQWWLLVNTRPDPIGALRRGDLSAWMLVGCVALLGSGYAADDLLRNVLPREPLQAFEELAELIGVTAFLGAVVGRLRPAELPAFAHALGPRAASV